MIQRRDFFLLLSTAMLAARAETQALELDAPNPVQVLPNLITSGQPSRTALASLGKLGIQAVIYLAPSTVPDAVKDEPELLKQQNIEFVHIPVPFGAPGESHFEAISAALLARQDKKVLIHCQVNMRASTMTFLHRVIALHEDPTAAYESVSRVWSPSGPWKRLVSELLKKHDINFQPL